MELSKEMLAQWEGLRTAAGRDVPLLGGDRDAFRAARESAEGALGLFTKKTDYVELYRFFLPHAEKWVSQQWHAPAVKAQKEDVGRCEAGCDILNVGDYKIYVHNGHCFVGAGHALMEQPNGVVYGSLAEAARCYPEIVAREYARQSVTAEDDLVRANAQLAEDGVFIYIPRGVRVEQPIEVIFTLDAKEAQRLDFRSLVVVEDLGDASVVYSDCTLSPVPHFTQQVTECAVGQSANLNFILLQNQHDEALQLHHVFAELQEGAQFSSNVFTVRGGAVRNNVYVTLKGQHAQASCNGLALVGAGQYVDMHTLVRHVAERCQSNQLYKTIVDGEGESNFYGIIDVQPGAQKTEAFQRNANILMSTAAKARTRPQLIIHADDVKCSHGATVGQFDEEARFYMMQRGLAPEDVNRLLVQGFAGDVVALVPHRSLREYLHGVVEDRVQ